MANGLSLTSYRLLGRSGLRVSPLALGTMTFGPEWGWGADQETARRIFEAYLDRGGNFIDTAAQYTNGSSEQFIGDFAAGRRDSLVIASKYTPLLAADPNSGGNHRKSMLRSVETSLHRLRTDYLDLLYLHAWDGTTSVEEILRAMDDLVRSGRVLYLGISNTPAWQVSRMQAIADLRGWSPLVALQAEYSLVERTSERELIPMAREMGLGVVPWSPLGSGVLTGKYSKADLSANRDGAGEQGTRKKAAIALGLVSERGLMIADVVKSIAQELGKSPAHVALAWTLLNPGVAATLIGARTLQQFENNLDALSTELSTAQQARLEAASAITLGFPHDYLEQTMGPGGAFAGVRLARANRDER